MQNAKFYQYYFFIIAIACSPLFAEKIKCTWSSSAEEVYDIGFMHMLMKHDHGGVRLFNMDLVENDSPGAGHSEKGASVDDIWGKYQARKIFSIDDPRAHELASNL